MVRMMGRKIDTTGWLLEEEGLLQASEGGEKHLWSWLLRTSWQLVLRVKHN